MNVYLLEYLDGYPEYVVADSSVAALEIFKVARPYVGFPSIKKINFVPVLMQQQYDKTSEVQNENK